MYCPWCRTEFEQELFHRDCGKPVALRAQPIVRLMEDAGRMPDNWINMTQKRIIYKVKRQHGSTITENIMETAHMEKEFASEERNRLLQQNDDMNDRFDNFIEQAENGEYAPEHYR